MSDNKRFEYLMQQYFDGKITADEKTEFAIYLQLLNDDHLHAKLQDQWNSTEAEKELSPSKSEQILAQIISNPIPNKTISSSKRNTYTLFFVLAASFLLLVTAGYFITIHLKKPEPVIAQAVITTPDKPTNYTRNLTLPDGSKVVLKEGSTINCPSTFSGETREIRLSGEAYFDIAHKNNQPFIIHTGSVRTVVLGTAFNIKAWPGDKDVLVTVTRGKVRVEKESDNHILAVLVKNQEVEYDNNTASAQNKNIEANQVVEEWTHKGLEFDHISLSHIANTLSKRFGVTIEIENQEVANMILVSSFSGTESLNDILDIICSVIPDVQYSIKNNVVKIKQTKP
jgi:ferric-dicitrate binding protein FerR (iron transport regulator)